MEMIKKQLLILGFLVLLFIVLGSFNKITANNGTVSLSSDILTIDYYITSSDIQAAQAQNPACSMSKYFVVVRLMNQDQLILNTWTPEVAFPITELHASEKIYSFSEQTKSLGLNDADRMQLFVQYMDQNDTCEVLVPKAYDQNTGQNILTLPTILFSQLPYSF